MEPTTLTTERLVLRPHAPADVDETFAALQDPEIQRWIPVAVPYPRSDAEKYVLESSPRTWREGTGFDFAVRLGAEGPLVATLGIHTSGEYAHEIGFWTVAGHRGRGYMTEAVLAAARWAFTELGCVRLIWRAGVGNTGSRAVAEKAGFVIEGLQRSAMEHRGVLRDCWVGALLPADLGLPSRLPHEPSTAGVGAAV
ncbi:GNAT family N-acetyltransferase [Streptomyces sp. NPDC089919]|uniref:GNAT family N-acetyltransferase n=1 Tax=Streptomyces sp. NPDC089919 TaxID=3155188 RepID=UPI003446D6FC